MLTKNQNLILFLLDFTPYQAEKLLRGIRKAVKEKQEEKDWKQTRKTV